MEAYIVKLLRTYRLIFVLLVSLIHFVLGQGILEFKAGEKILLDCRTTESSGNRNYTWSKNSTQILNGDRIKIDNFGRLVILNSIPSDKGTYVCSKNGSQRLKFFVEISSTKTESLPSTAKSTFHSPLLTSSTVTTTQKTGSLEVTTERTRKNLWFVNHIPGDVQLIKTKAGASVALDCLASGFPSPKIQWFKWKQPIKDVSYRLVGADNNDKLWKFQMPNVVLADSGDYYCVVKNVLATIKRMFHVVVQEHDAMLKPTIVAFSPSNKTVLLGSSVLFKCAAGVQDKMPFMRWEKRMLYDELKQANMSAPNNTNKVDRALLERMKYIRSRIKSGNVTVRERSNQRELVEHLKTERAFSSRLLLGAVDFTDEAEYLCIAFNSIGYSAVKASLYVKPVPQPTLEELAKRYASKFGDNSPYSDLPLSVIIALPVGLIVLLAIGFIWWNEQHQRKKDSDRMSLIPLSTMRNEDMFDSEEHLPSHYPKIHQKRLSQGKATSEEDNQSSLHIEEEAADITTEKVMLKPVVGSPDSNDKSKNSLKDEEKPECDRRPFAPLLPEVEICSPEPDSINCSEGELEWEPQDLDLNLGRVH